MVHAFVLVKTGPGASPDVLSALDGIDAVVDAHIVAGQFDLILEVDAVAVGDILTSVTDGIQHLDGVLDTRTYIAME